MNVPVLHVVATDEVADRLAFRAQASEILKVGGVRVALHLRLRHATARTLHALARELSGAAREAGGWCVVNERVDVALCAGAQGVQLGFGALPPPAVRELGGGAIAIGASVHSPEEARWRAREGADYLVAGSVFATPTHTGTPPAGVELIASSASAGIPVVGIGGIGAANARQVLEAGAVGVAVVRAVWSAPDPVAAAVELITILTAADGVPAGPATEGAMGTSRGN